MPDNQFWRRASGRLTFEMSRVSADSYRAVRDAAVSAFRLVPDTDPVSNGLDTVFQDFRRGDQVVGLEWDNWTCFTVVAKTPGSEQMIRDIAAWLLQSQWATLAHSAEGGG